MDTDCYQVRRRAGEIIFREGEAADCAYVIEAGRIEVSVSRQDGAVVLGELGPGEILGEMAVIDQAPRTATATVTEDCILTTVTARQIQQRIERSDPIVRSLLGVLLERYRSELALTQEPPALADSGFVQQTSIGIEKIRFENDLRRALEHGEVKVVYQPIHCLRRNLTAGFEALVRWDHPAEGTIPAARLVALAEETDLIIPLSLYVLRTAVQDFSVLEAAAPGDLFASVNVSPRHTMDSEFLNQAWDICAAAERSPQDLMLELTESIRVDIDQLADWTRTARAMGFRLSVDDFGTGYASLEYLTRLQPDTVKIDQNFVRAITGDWRHRAVMTKVLAMAAELGVVVIAEGAETSEHVRVLSRMNCDMAQGYETGRPLAVSEAVAFLAE
ncbi:MAG TPA: EAL domain-containing protein [Arenicellales bacterium]|nr:EAL domain-containing protein [Arenicellales bacterium]